ncbi:MAG: Arc family DNA binding domain-containing protein [Pseudoxanthomonas suwonensis]|nr:MAG: Arc family DNA binding domain-containing protein [Pseudoxanthomonas suwonensis]
MSGKKAYPLRISVEVLEAAQRWADDELRSLNAQIEYVLRDALRKAGRLRTSDATQSTEQADDAD